MFIFLVLYTQCGSLAQLVEQRPEVPCVTSSSLVGATISKLSKMPRTLRSGALFCWKFVLP